MLNRFRCRACKKLETLCIRTQKQTFRHAKHNNACHLGFTERQTNYNLVTKPYKTLQFTTIVSEQFETLAFHVDPFQLVVKTVPSDYFFGFKHRNAETNCPNCL